MIVAGVATLWPIVRTACVPPPPRSRCASPISRDCRSLTTDADGHGARLRPSAVLTRRCVRSRWSSSSVKFHRFVSRARVCARRRYFVFPSTARAPGRWTIKNNRKNPRWKMIFAGRRNTPRQRQQSPPSLPEWFSAVLRRRSTFPLSARKTDVRPAAVVASRSPTGWLCDDHRCPSPERVVVSVICPLPSVFPEVFESWRKNGRVLSSKFIHLVRECCRRRSELCLCTSECVSVWVCVCPGPLAPTAVEKNRFHPVVSGRPSCFFALFTTTTVSMITTRRRGRQLLQSSTRNISVQGC